MKKKLLSVSIMGLAFAKYRMLVKTELIASLIVSTVECVSSVTLRPCSRAEIVKAFRQFNRKDTCL